MTRGSPRPTQPNGRRRGGAEHATDGESRHGGIDQQQGWCSGGSGVRLTKQRIL